MGACASKFSVLKTAADAPPPAKEEVVVEKNDESKPQSLGLLFKEVKSKGGEKGPAESNGEAYGNLKSSESVADAPAKDDLQKEAETDCTKPENKAENVEICAAETKKNEDQKPTEDAEKQKPAETTELEIDAEKNKEEAKSTGTIKIETLDKKEEEKPAETRELETAEMDEKSEKKPETPEIGNTEKQIPASDAGGKKAQGLLAHNTKIETSDKHVLEPTKTEKSSENKRDETPEASDAGKPKAEEHK